MVRASIVESTLGEVVRRGGAGLSALAKLGVGALGASVRDGGRAVTTSGGGDGGGGVGADIAGGRSFVGAMMSAAASTSSAATKKVVDRVVDGVDFRPRTDTSCFVESFPASGAATAVMFVFISGCVLGAMPQYLKLIVLGSAEGLSLTSLALTNVSNLCASLNVFILHFEQIRYCVQGEDGYEYDRCQASLLTLYYTLIYTLLWMPMYALAAHFSSDKKVAYFGHVMTERRAAWYGMVLHLLPCIVLLAPAIRMLFGSTCYEFENYAIMLGVMNAVFETTRYVPQLWESIHSGVSGAMSYMRLLLSIAGGLGATIQKALMDESWSTWGPPLIGHGLELSIFFVNLYNDMRSKRADEATDNESSELVEDDEAKRKIAMLESAEAKSLGIDPTASDDDDDWIANMPKDAGFGAKTSYIYHRMCTDRNFFTSLVRYL